ncbi:ParA family protein [Sphingobacterium composti Ten et al. 2007 non Yoo et al. 2007]|uniref:ParA family protein n=1 Tax=Sphingobacterium composti TaxID=363260 RepID=UPI001357C252
MIILIGNIKGGVGKSTLTLALANYLTQEHRRWVGILDLDFKHCLINMQKNTQILQTPSLYTIYDRQKAESINLLTKIKENPHKILLIDLPSSIEDAYASEYVSLADVILCPFSYDQFTINATLLFSLVITKLNPRAPCCFIPNRIKNFTKIESKMDIELTLSKFGTIASVIYDRIDFQKLNNIHTPTSLLNLILPTLDSIYHQYLQR